ncbi:hypothetical protein GCM10009647_085130 [Streptomyces sanglieri]
MRENAVASQDELSDDGLVDAIGKDQRRELGREGTELVRLFPWSGHPDNGSRWSRMDGQASGTWVRGAVVPADILARLAPHVTRRTSERTRTASIPDRPANETVSTGGCAPSNGTWETSQQVYPSECQWP